MMKPQAIIGALAATAATVFIIHVWMSPRLEESDPPALSHYQFKAAMESSAQLALTNAIYKAQPGVNRIIDASVNSNDDNPTNWTGQATVDYVNQIGGVERKILFFRFGRYLSTNIYCYQDDVAQYDFERKLRGE